MTAVLTFSLSYDDTGCLSLPSRLLFHLSDNDGPYLTSEDSGLELLKGWTLESVAGLLKVANSGQVVCVTKCGTMPADHLP